MASPAPLAASDIVAVAEMAKLVGEQDQFKVLFHDGGPAKAKVTLAMDALGRDGRWTLLQEGEPHGPAPPPICILWRDWPLDAGFDRRTILRDGDSKLDGGAWRVEQR